MNALFATLLGFLGAGGIVFAVEAWIRRREQRAAEAERKRVELERSALRHSIERADAEIETGRIRAHAAIDARPKPTTPEERLAEIKRRNRSAP